jgi:protocatechuate 3,4-dioxygenase beta subunit
MDTPRRFTRRQAIAAAATGAAGLGAGAYVLLRDDGETNAPKPATTAADKSDTCVLTPEQTEGPFYIEDSLVRRDVTEGRDGVPLELRLTVQDATSCEPIRNATVEIWHCDALGAYSGEGETFLRGGQRSKGGGQVTFQTIYPGWYQGRTPHIHVKVHVGGQVVHTGQLYFDDATTDRVYERTPYASRGGRETTNAQDGIYGDGGDRSTLALSEAGRGYVGRLTLGIKT